MYQIILCVFCRICAVAAFQRSKEIIERQAVLVPQQPRLCSQILPEFRQILLDSAEQRIESLSLHVRLMQCLIQRRSESAQFAAVDDFQLDGVEGVRASVLDPVVALDLRLKSLLPDFRIRIVCKVADFREVCDPSFVFHRYCGCEESMQISPRGCSGDGVDAHHFLHFGRKGVLRVVSYAL